MKYPFRFSRCSIGSAAFALAALAALCGQPTSAKATAYSYTGSLDTTDPKFNRPVSTTSLSAVGTAVYYDVQPFTVSLGSSVRLSVDSTTFTDADSFLALYSTSFNPTSPLTNLVAINDDDPSRSGLLSAITATLTPLTSYFLVTTTYANGVTGTYNDSITPANALSVVVPGVVPEPGSLAFISAGLVGAAGWVRRKTRRS